MSRLKRFVVTAIRRATARGPRNPALPTALLIGDSIMLGYHPHLRRMLAGRFNVERIPDNGLSSGNVLANLDQWLDRPPYAVIHFNAGLHDLFISRKTSAAEYEANIRAIASRLQATGADVIFATTTPVPPGAIEREVGGETALNEIAVSAMKDIGVPVNDLCAAEAEQLPGNVHFSKAGYAHLAEHVANAVSPTL